MILKYKTAKYLLLAGLQLCCLNLRAQNVPNTETAPAGTVSTFTAPPEPELSVVNSIQVFQPQIPITDPAQVTSASTPGQVKRSVILKDGFQRTVQTIQTYYSRSGGVYKNLVGISDNRAQPENTTYLPYAIGSDQAIVRDNPFAEQQAYYGSLYPGEGYTSFSKERVFSDAGTRQVQSLAPGKSQVGQGRATTVTQTTNTGGEVRLWSLDAAGQPVSPASYAAGELFGTLSQSPASAGNPAPFVLTYTNKSGRVVMTKETDTVYTGFDASAQKKAANYRITYYVYDDMGRLRYTLSPKAVLAAEKNHWILVQTVIDNLCFQYQYDEKGRLRSQRFPGEMGFTYFIYDRQDRLVLRQTPAEKEQSKLEVTFYDKLDRVIATAIYSDAPYNHPEDWQSLFDTYTGTYLPNDFRYYLGFNPEGIGLYPPQNTNNTDIQSYTYYDNYDQVDQDGSKFNSYNNTLAFSETLNTPGAETPVRSLRTRGLVTGTWVKILPSPSANQINTGNWSTGHNYYDDKGRLINHLKLDVSSQGGQIHYDYSGTQYDFLNRPLISKRIFQNLYASTTVHSVLEKNSYEPVTGQLTQTDRKFGTGGWHTTGSYLYDDMGRVKEHMIGLFGEYQDFSYNIRGQLTGINANYAETGNKGGKQLTFGEALYYDYGFSKPRYDGKIVGMKWKGSAETNAYGYSYDLSGRLTSADYRYKGLNWSMLGRDYTVSKITYDKNGNLKTMNQKGNKPGGGPVDMDILSYSYEDGEQSNRLSWVTDKANDYALGDFVNTNGSNKDYEYDENGSLTKDANKGIDNISYTYFNKPQVITFSNGKSIEYSYDATGAKVQELVTNPGNAGKVTDYVGGFIYEGNSLQYLLTGEGRAIWDGIASTYKEEYFVKDHLGNVRSTIDITDKPLLQYLATYEIASANLEGLLFDQVNEIREDKPNSTDPGDVKSGRLNGTDPNRRTGTSLLMHVMADDQVDISVNNFYEGYDSRQDNPVKAGDMMASIISTLTGGVGGLGGSESHNPDMVQQLFGPENYLNAYEELTQTATDPDKPKAYLNYVLFDENMQVNREFSKAVQVNGNGSWQTIGTGGAVTIPVNGYLAVYLSTRSQTVACIPCGDVWFDQLSIKIQKGRLLEETHYYPHGLPMAAMSTDAQNNTKAQRHKYQGNEYIKDLGLNWMDFQARQYDPQLGRFLGVDPRADQGGQQTLSPYAAMGNMPESMIDPNGEQFGGNMPNIIQKDYGNAADPMGEISGTIKDMMEGGPMGGTGRSGGGSNFAFNGWGYGSDKFVQAGNDKQKSKTFDEMVNAAKTNPGQTIYNYGATILDYLRIGTDQYGNSQYLYSGTSDHGGTVGVYGKGYDPNDIATSQRNDAITVDAGMANLEDSDGSWWQHLIGPAMVGIGQPWVPKRFIAPGSSPGSSIISTLLSKVPVKSPVRLYAPVVNKAGARWVGTKLVGRWAARWVPFVGWGLTAYDFTKYVGIPMAEGAAANFESNTRSGNWIGNLDH